MNESYGKLSDEELVHRYQQGDNAAADYLVEKYKNLVRKEARSYFLVGADQDDLLQEGMIGLYKAIRDYSAEKKAAFMTFASLCIGRQLRSAMTSYSRKKNTPLNSAISLDAPASEEAGEETTLSEALSLPGSRNPEDILIEREQEEHLIKQAFGSLSPMERQVLELFLEGLTYGQIADFLSKSEKAIDNAIQRIRTKLSAYR